MFAEPPHRPASEGVGHSSDNGVKKDEQSRNRMGEDFGNRLSFLIILSYLVGEGVRLICLERREFRCPSRIGLMLGAVGGPSSLGLQNISSPRTPVDHLSI